MKQMKNSDAFYIQMYINIRLQFYGKNISWTKTNWNLITDINIRGEIEWYLWMKTEVSDIN